MEGRREKGRGRRVRRERELEEESRRAGADGPRGSCRSLGLLMMCLALRRELNVKRSSREELEGRVEGLGKDQFGGRM